MKRQIINTLAALFLVAIATPSKAQEGGLLKGLKDKINNVGSKDGGSKSGGNSMEKELAKDSASTILNNRPVRPDASKLSGLYTAKFPMRVTKDNNGGYGYVKKFLVELEEQNHVVLHFHSRVSVENNLSALAYTTRPNTPDYFPITNSKKLGHYLLDGLVDMYGIPASKTYSMEANVLDFSKPAGQEVVSTGWGLEMPYVLQLEPGILVIAQLDYIMQAKTPEQYKVLQEKGTYNLFYKEEMKSKALAMTDAEVWDKCKAFFTKYMDAYMKADAERGGLPKPTDKFKEEPTNASLVEAVKKRMQQMPYYRDRELLYVYPVMPWEHMFENIGLLGKTLTYRQMQVIAVFKHGDKCQYARMLMRQDNSYSGGTATERFTGNPVFCSGDQQLEDVKCERAMEYKK